MDTLGFIEMVDLVLVRNNKVFQGTIRVVPIKKLYLHEEIIESNLNALIRVIKKRNIFQDPVIVDRNSGVILDGMHRTETLKRLGYDYIIAYLVDYNDPAIKIRRWCRLFKLPHYLIKKEERLNKMLDEIAKSLNLDIFICGLKEAEKHLIKREILGYIVKGPDEEVNCIKWRETNHDIHKIYLALRDFEERVKKRLALQLSYHPDEKLEPKNNFKNYLFLIPPQISKKEVVNCAKKRKLFPPKSTRHIIPLRPFFVNIPLFLLRKSTKISIEKVNKIVDAILIQRQRVRLRGKIIIDRLYEDDYIDIFA